MKLSERLESVSRALALAHQNLMHLGTAIHTDSFDDFDAEAIYAITLVVEVARNDARIVEEALPAPLRFLELPDDYKGPNLGGHPLQPVLDDYRKRAGKEALAEAMGGRSRNAERRSNAKASATTSRRRKAA